MTKFGYMEKVSEVSMARAFYQKAMAKYEAAKASVEKAKAKIELELREKEYFAVSGTAFA